MKKLFSTLLLVSAAFGASAFTVTNAVNNLDAVASAQAFEQSPRSNGYAKLAAPSGEHRTYTRSSYYFYVMLSISIGNADSYATDIIYTDNAEVYIKAPLSYDKMPSDTYIKGELKEDIITVKLPQTYTSIDGSEYVLNRLEYKITDEEQQKGMYYVADNNQITFTIQQDGTVKMEESYIFSDEIDLPDFILGMTDTAGNWTGFGDFNQVYTPFSDTITTMPADADTQKMLIHFDQYAADVRNVGIKDGKVFIPGFNPYCPEACIVGEIDGANLSFKAGQYVGVDDYFKSFAYFWAGKYEMGINEYTGLETMQLVAKPSLDATWDANNKTFTSKGVLIVNLGNDELAYINLLNDVYSTDYNSEAEPARPMAPVFDVVNEYNPDEYYKYGSVRFLLPMIDVNGNLLDTSKLYYKFFIDGVPYEFKTSEYEELKENMIEIPWNFTDTDSYGGYDFKTNNITHIVYFYDPSMKMLDHMALQQYYKIDNDNILASDMTYYGKPSAVNEIHVEDNNIVSTQYFNLQGVNVANPSAGIYIKVTRSADGKMNTTKVNLR